LLGWGSLLLKRKRNSRLAGARLNKKRHGPKGGRSLRTFPIRAGGKDIPLWKRWSKHKKFLQMISYWKNNVFTGNTPKKGSRSGMGKEHVQKLTKEDDEGIILFNSLILLASVRKRHDCIHIGGGQSAQIQLAQESQGTPCFPVKQW